MKVAAFYASLTLHVSSHVTDAMRSFYQSLSSSPSDHGLRRGIRPGEGAVREVAAYLLDHEHFAGVPPTALVSCHDSGPLPSEYSKIGSLQVGALSSFLLSAKHSKLS